MMRKANAPTPVEPASVGVNAMSWLLEQEAEFSLQAALSNGLTLKKREPKKK